MNIKAIINNNTAVMKGADCVFAKFVIASANSPAVIATTPFKVVITPNISLNEPPMPSKCCLWYSVTIQLSKTLYISVVEMPPRIRPANNMNMESKRIARQESAYVMQKARQACLRPCLSARDPTNEAEMAAARKPVVKRWATVSSGRLC
jgi:hypothetical protein